MNARASFIWTTTGGLRPPLFSVTPPAEEDLVRVIQGWRARRAYPWLLSFTLSAWRNPLADAGQRSEVRGQRSEVRDQKSAVSTQQSDLLRRLTGSWLAVGPGRHPHSAEFRLLFRRQLVLEANAQAEMEVFDLTLRIQHLVELGQGLLFVDGIRFHYLVQRFHGVLKLPLQLEEARRRFLNLTAHEGLLFVGESDFARVGHDQLRRKHHIAQWIHRGYRRHRRARRRRRSCILWWLLCPQQRNANQQTETEYCDYDSDSSFHCLLLHCELTSWPVATAPGSDMTVCLARMFSIR